MSRAILRRVAGGVLLGGLLAGCGSSPEGGPVEPYDYGQAQPASRSADPDKVAAIKARIEAERAGRGVPASRQTGDGEAPFGLTPDTNTPKDGEGGWLTAAPLEDPLSAPEELDETLAFERRLGPGEIATVQSFLNARNYAVGLETGEMTERTRNAIDAWQRDAGLQRTGTIDLELLKAASAFFDRPIDPALLPREVSEEGTYDTRDEFWPD